MSDQWSDRLSDYLDGELPDSERIAFESHLQSCQECSADLRDLRRVILRARTLKPRTPSHDLWPGIASRIGATPGDSNDIVDLTLHRPARRWSFSLPQLMAAGIALMALSGGTVWMLRNPAAPAPIVGTAPSNSPVINASLKPDASRSYAAAVADLERVLANGRGQLDTTTVRIIEQNLAAIDQAIAQAQRALNADPANLYLNTHLAETMRRKLDLLRQAAALVPVS
jgi:putative zinc finger protein